MGWQVISFVNIDLYQESGIITKELSKKIDKILKDADALNVSLTDAGVSFELSGNKGVDYEPVDKIKKLMLKDKLKFEIVASEYVECSDGGYFFDTTDGETK